MEDIKERNFIVEVNNALQEEVRVDKCIILESGSEFGVVNYVMYEDRFGREWQIYYSEKNGYSKTEYKKLKEWGDFLMKEIFEEMEKATNEFFEYVEGVFE